MNVPEINIEDAKKKLDAGEAIFLDIRDPGSFEEAHIPEATHLTNESLPAFLKDTEATADIVVYCYHGNSSRGATAFLIEQGFSKVASMSGGFQAWRTNYDSDPA